MIKIWQATFLKTIITIVCKQIIRELPLTGTSVSGIPSTTATKIQTTSPIFDVIMYRINCLVLLYMALPSATAYEQMVEQDLDKYHLKITAIICMSSNEK